jgi:four helix bundle protein
MSDFKGLIVYQKAFENAMAIFEVTKEFPSHEKFGLISQIRRSSRSVCSCIAESYRKRQYLKHFIAKLSDSDMENSETIVWLDFALSCGYINEKKYQILTDNSVEVGKLLNHMIFHPDKYR